VVYGREINGEVTTFGTTGYTYRSTFVLYDRVTNSVWYPQKTNEMNAIGGSCVGESIPFIAKPKIVKLSQWRASHPDSLVLVGRSKK